MIGVIQADAENAGVRAHRRDELDGLRGHRRAAREVLLVDKAVRIAPELGDPGQRQQFAVHHGRNFDRPRVTDPNQTHLLFPPSQPRRHRRAPFDSESGPLHTSETSPRYPNHPDVSGV